LLFLDSNAAFSRRDPPHRRGHPIIFFMLAHAWTYCER
jgi:hypothetical protein